MKSINRGQSLFEVVVALAISTVIITALVALATSSIRNATFSKNKTIASRYAQEATEWLRSERDKDPQAFQTKALTAAWCMQALSWDMSGHCNAGDEIFQTSFKREVAFTIDQVLVGSSNKTLIRTDVSVIWADAQGSHEVRNSTDFSDWRQR